MVSGIADAGSGKQAIAHEGEAGRIPRQMAYRCDACLPRVPATRSAINGLSLALKKEG